MYCAMFVTDELDGRNTKYEFGSGYEMLLVSIGSGGERNMIPTIKVMVSYVAHKQIICFTFLVGFAQSQSTLMARFNIFFTLCEDENR